MDCYGREEEASDVWARLDMGQNLLMLAPRRIGKTVLLNHLRDNASTKGYRAIVLDVEGFNDEKDFFRQCCSSIQEELSTGVNVMSAFTHRLKNVLKGDEGMSGDWRQWLVQTDWQEFANQLFTHLNDNQDDPPWLILVDELPVFVQSLEERSGKEALSGFLYWLRGMRQKHTNIRWLYTGSVGLDTVARRNNVEGALNDLHPYTLLPYSEGTASSFLDAIATSRGCEFSNEAIQCILKRLGWLSPYYLERIAEDACLCSEEGQKIEPEGVENSMDRLLELPKRLYWASWREHLDRNFVEPERSRLYAVLEITAKNPDGVTFDTLISILSSSDATINASILRSILDTLIADGYLNQNEGGRYNFLMNLLREWWLRYVVI